MKLDELKKRLEEEGCSFEEQRVEFPPGSKKYITGLCWRRTVGGTTHVASVQHETSMDGDDVYTSAIKSICTRLRIPMEKLGVGPKSN